MKLKLNVHKLEKGENEFTGIVMLNDEEFSLIIKNEQERKQIELPYSMGRLVPLSNFTSIPRSVLRLSIKCISPTSNTNDDLFVERKTHFEKRNESDGNWLFTSKDPMEISSDILFDFFTNHIGEETKIEIIPK